MAIAEEQVSQGNGSGAVEATERLYRSLFLAAALFALAAAIWGLVIAPFNSFNDHHGRSVIIGGIAVMLAGVGLLLRRSLFFALRRNHAWLLAIALLGVAVLWSDGGWRSSFYLASYAAIAFAAVAGSVRWSLACGAVLAAGYLGGLAINGYSWEELKELKDADSVVANTGGYLIAAYFFAAPVAWLGGYVARINQVIGDSAARAAGGEFEPPVRRQTAALSVREVQVTQLVAEGMTNDEIAQRLVLSPRTVQSHVRNAMKKTGSRSRTDLAIIALREGLLPPN